MRPESHPRGGAKAELAVVLPYLRRFRALAAATALLGLALALVDIPAALALKPTLDSALGTHRSSLGPAADLAPREFLFAVFVVLVALALLKAALLFTYRLCAENLGQRTVHALRVDLWTHLQSLSLRYFREASTGRLMLRLMGDVTAVNDMLTDGFLRAFVDVVTVIGVAAALFLLHPALAAAVLAGLPLYVWSFRRLSPALRESGRRVRRERARLSGDLQERIAGAATVKSFDRSGAEIERLSRRTRKLRDRLLERARLGGLLAGLAHASVAFGGALVLWIGGNAVLDGSLTKGGLMAFWALAAMLFTPLRRLARTNETWQSARVSLERLASFLESTTTMRDADGAAELSVGAGEVTFERVSFAWQPDRPALDGVDLRVRGGEIVALVGSNGAGKSTLAALVNRLIVPDSGRVTIDGQDLRDVTAASLRRQVCVVAQEAFLFAGSIAENIRYARPDASEAEILAAARTARVTDFALGLPDGLDTEVGERGQRLSGGQVQRIALARAALVNPRVLILDEATSAVDGESESQIQEALFRLMDGRTVFVVAHRAATVRRADRVVVLDRGRVVEEGPHADLMRRRGFYARLFEEQILLRSALSV